MINHAMMTFIQSRTDEITYYNQWNYTLLKYNVTAKKDFFKYNFSWQFFFRRSYIYRALSIMLFMDIIFFIVTVYLFRI